MPPKPRSMRLSLILLSVVITGVVALGLAFIFRHDALRWYYLQKLRSTDAAVRLHGMAYVCRHAPDDPAVRDTMRDWLSDPATDKRLRSDIIRSLRCADVWGPAFGRSWVAWFDRILDDTDNPATPGMRIGICFELARAGFDHQPVINDPAPGELLLRLARDDDADVRYWAVRCAAVLPDESRAKVIGLGLHDSEAVIVRHANIIDALSRGQSPAAPITDYAALYKADLAQLADVYRSAAADDSPQADARAAYAASRLAPHLGSDPAADVLRPLTWSGREGYKLRELAVFENLQPQSLDLTVSDDWPPLVRVAAARAAKTIDDTTLSELFNADESSVRLLACLPAVDRLDPAHLRTLIDKLNHTFHVNKRICGAMLIGLTGLSPDMLAERLGREHIWLVRQHLLLAQWMLGRSPVGFDINGLLANSAFPRDTAYLALLQRGRIEALDLVFQPFSPDAGQLRELLNQQRFIMILNRYLAAGQPTFDPYADVETQLFQCDVLRDWYMIHRADLHFDTARRQFELTPATSP